MTSIVSAAFDDPAQSDRLSEFRARVIAELSALQTERVLCGISAVKWWHLPLPPGLELMAHSGSLHTAALPGARLSTSARAMGHEIDLPDSHLVCVEGVNVTVPVRTWLDMAGQLSQAHLVALGDRAVHLGLANVSDLRAVVEWGRRRRGIIRARECVGFIDGRSESPPESWMRWTIHQAGLPVPEPNVEVVVRGNRIRRIDLAYRTLRIGLEYDGDWHAWQREEDSRRRETLEKAGWQIVVFYKEDLDDPGAFIERVRSALRSRETVLARW